MKASLSKIIITVLLIYSLLSTSCISFVSMAPIIGDLGNWRFLIFVFSILSFVFYITNKFRFRTYTKKCIHFFDYYAFAFWVCMLIISLWSMNKYGESILDIIITSEGQYYIFLVPAFIYVFFRNKNEEIIFEKLNILLVIVITIYVFVNVLYLVASINLFNLASRFGHLRFDPPAFGGIILIYNLWLCLTRKKIKPLLIFCYYLIFLFTMSGTRMEMIASISAVVVTILVIRKGVGPQMIFIIALSFAIAIMSQHGIFDIIIQSFDTSNSLGVSTRVRLEAIEYFTSIYTKNPLFGMGYVRGGVNKNWDYILYGPVGKYVFSDLGLYGFYLKTGMFSFVFAGIPIIRIIYIFICICISRAKKYNEKMIPLLAGLVTYMIICQISLSITDIQRSIMLPIYWAFFEYVYYKALKIKEY